MKCLCQQDTRYAQLDVERGVVVCTKLSDRYVNPEMPGVVELFGPASLHLVDYTAYWDNLRENIQTRINACLPAFSSDMKNKRYL